MVVQTRGPVATKTAKLSSLYLQPHHEPVTSPLGVGDGKQANPDNSMSSYPSPSNSFGFREELVSKMKEDAYCPSLDLPMQG